MNLCVDIGNTNIKLGAFIKDELKEVCVQLAEADSWLAKYKFRHAIVSRTGANPGMEEKLSALRVPVMELTPALKLPFNVRYKTPQTLGADRIAGTAGAMAMFPGTNVLKIDFGTCITYDFIDERHNYHGGAISPGMMMRFKALHNYTARLPLVDPMQFTQYELTGSDTAGSIASGVINGITNEVSGIINEYSLRFGSLKVIASGGDSGLFVTLIKSEIFARPYLVLEGLNSILNHNL